MGEGKEGREKGGGGGGGRRNPGYGATRSVDSPVSMAQEKRH